MDYKYLLSYWDESKLHIIKMCKWKDILHIELIDINIKSMKHSSWKSTILKIVR